MKLLSIHERPGQLENVDRLIGELCEALEIHYAPAPVHIDPDPETVTIESEESAFRAFTVGLIAAAREVRASKTAAAAAAIARANTEHKAESETVPDAIADAVQRVGRAFHRTAPVSRYGVPVGKPGTVTETVNALLQVVLAVGDRSDQYTDAIVRASEAEKEIGTIRAAIDVVKGLLK